jgi:hypothetical protein
MHDGKTRKATAMSDLPVNRLQEAIQRVSEKYDADILVYIGYLFEPDDERILHTCRSRDTRKKNVLMILSTPGGSADAAYRISRCLQRAYQTKHEDLTIRGNFYLYVHDMCTSAGTLLALGASSLIMSQRSQLGPIDVQLRREDEVGERRSGLTSRTAMETLSSEAGRAFRSLFRYMRFDRSLQLSTKMAAELAATMTVGMMEPVYAQLDPMRLGEVERFVRISQEYGDRLRSPNVKKGTIERLLGSYPSHEFVIDREEASELFEKVEKPSDDLEFVAEIIIGNNHPTEDDQTTFIQYINVDQNTPSAAPSQEAHHVQKNATTDGESSTRTRPSSGQVRPDAPGDQTGEHSKPNGFGHLDAEQTEGGQSGDAESINT